MALDQIGRTQRKLEAAEKREDWATALMYDGVVDRLLRQERASREPTVGYPSEKIVQRYSDGRALTDFGNIYYRPSARERALIWSWRRPRRTYAAPKSGAVLSTVLLA